MRYCIYLLLFPILSGYCLVTEIKPFTLSHRASGCFRGILNMEAVDSVTRILRKNLKYRMRRLICFMEPTHLRRSCDTRDMWPQHYFVCKTDEALNYIRLYDEGLLTTTRRTTPTTTTTTPHTTTTITTTPQTTTTTTPTTTTTNKPVVPALSPSIPSLPQALGLVDLILEQPSPTNSTIYNSEEIETTTDCVCDRYIICENNSVSITNSTPSIYRVFIYNDLEGFSKLSLSISENSKLKLEENLLIIIEPECDDISCKVIKYFTN